MRNEIQAGLPSWFDFDFVTATHYYHLVLTKAGAISKEEYRTARRKLAENDLFFLLTNVLNRHDLFKPWLYNRCRDVQRAPDGHLDLWAREHYKSTIITFGLTIFDIVRDPETTIGIFSHTKSIARDFVRQIKTEFEQNTLLNELWPEVFWLEPAREAPRWSIDGGIVVKRAENPKEATVEGHGLVDGQPTGRHFKKRVYDDVVTLESVNTAEQIQKTTHAWRMSDNLGSEGGSARYIGTRYHMFDTYSVMLEDEIAIPRMFPATENGQEWGKPVLLSDETLAKKRQNQGAYVFAAQMLLNPVADKAMGFRHEWLVLADTDELSAMNSLWRFIIVDPAGGKQRKNNDYTTFMVIGYGFDEKYRVLDMRRDRMTLSQRTDTLIALHRKWQPGLVAYEEYGMQSDIEHIKYVQKQLLYEFEIVTVGGSMSKSLRILRLIPYFENGFKSVEDGGDGIPKSRIIFPTTCNQLDHEGQMHDLVKSFIEHEYVAFPVLKHDDMIDCLARIVDLESKDLIRKPLANAPKAVSHRVEEGLRRMGNRREGNQSWTTV
jgi:phage terminase large subunit-like protein